MKRLTLLLTTLALVLTACGGDTAAVTLVDPATAAETIETEPDLVVLDIRTPEEVAAGVLPGSISVVDFYSPDFAAQLEGLDKDATYLVYCRSGNRSAQATELMTDLGFTSVLELDGGITRWATEGREIVPG